MPPNRPRKAWRLVLLGAPGVGKGTQAEFLCEGLGTCHLSTGDVFRSAKKLADDEKTPAINAALQFMRSGALVPDQTVLDMVAERLRCLHCSGGFLLDGFPRTVAQAEAMDALLKREGLSLTAVVDYELPIEKVVARLSGRRTCPGCNAVYHVTANPPRVEGVCNHCGGKLYQREDDRPEAIKVRMEAYEKSTRPLIDYYRKQGILVTVAAEGSPDDIYNRTLADLDSARATGESK
jgi:adenylate kinase